MNRLPEADDLRVLVVLSPGSSNFEKAQLKFEYIQMLGFAGINDFIHTSVSRQETADILGEKLTAGTEPYHAVVIETGDGSANTVVRALHAHSDARLRAKPVVFGKGGGACDGHAMTQGIGSDYLPKLPGQAIREIRPLELAANTLDGTIIRREKIVEHLVFGGMGRVAYAVNGDTHRRSKLLRKPYLHELQEIITAAKSLDPFDKFYLREDSHAEHRLVSDIVMTNGDTMGRRRIFPGDIFEPGYHQVIAPNLVSVIGTAGLMLAGKRDTMEPRQQSDFYITRRGRGKHTLVSYDGETFQLPLGDGNDNAITHLHVAVSDSPLRVATIHEPRQ